MFQPPIEETKTRPSTETRTDDLLNMSLIYNKTKYMKEFYFYNLFCKKKPFMLRLFFQFKMMKAFNSLQPCMMN